MCAKVVCSGGVEMVQSGSGLPRVEACSGFTGKVFVLNLCFVVFWFSNMCMHMHARYLSMKGARATTMVMCMQ